MIRQPHEGDSALLLAVAARLLAGMGCDTGTFVVMLLPEKMLNQGHPIELRVRKFHGENLPAVPGEAGEAKVGASGWLEFSDLERRIIEALKARAGEWTRADDLADVIGESSNGDLKAAIRGLAERSRGQIESAQGRGVRFVKPES